jgi:Protein of unknown function (DUF4058)
MQAKSIKNQYLGVNAHLHSFWQSEAGWGGFHTTHLGDILKALKARLLPMGYTADAERSLQIRRIGDSPRTPRADGIIYDLDPVRSNAPYLPSSGHIQRIPMAELLDEDELSEKPYQAIRIFELEANAPQPGKPVAWLELLSPTNKGDTRDAETYRAKRLNVMASGLVFVEIDYLHETPATFFTLPNYQPVRGRARHGQASPYHIIVADPRPILEDGEALVVPFYVDEPIPMVHIPLNAGDSLEFDFDLLYRKTFEEMFYGYNLDYARLPMNFDRYSEADQTRIAARMLSVLEAAGDGVDLETGPFPVKSLPLAESLAQMEAITGEPIS